MKFPKIEDSKTFELLARDIIQVKFNINCSIYGRNGQNQSGIDLFTSGNRRMAIQCKDYLVNKSISEVKTNILTEIEKLKGLMFPVSEFWFVTALSRDVNMQNEIEKLNPILTGSCNIYVLFWEDIEEVLSSNLLLIQKYFPFFRMEDDQNYRTLFCLGFFSQIFADYIELMRFERNDALTYCDIVENGLEWVSNINTQSTIRIHLEAMRRYLTEPLDLVKSFKKEDAYEWCMVIERSLISINGSLNNVSINYFRLGQYLGYFDKVLNFMNVPEKKITKLKFDEFVDILSNIKLNEKDKDFIANDLKIITESDDENSLNSNKYGMPSRVYDYLCNHL